MDNSCLSIDYVTITDVDVKSFDRKQSYYGKPKGIAGIRKYQRDLERNIDTVTNAISILTASGCSSFIPQLVPKEYVTDWGLCNPETKELVYDPRDRSNPNYDPNYYEAMSKIEKCLEEHYKTNWLVRYIDEHNQDIKPVKLEKILKYLDPVIEKLDKKLIAVQKEYEEASKPVPVEDWKLVFTFDKASIVVKGQTAKNLYTDIERNRSGINLKMHISKVSHSLYETKLALIVDSYEIL